MRWTAYNAIGARLLKNWRIVCEDKLLVATVAERPGGESEAQNAYMIAAAPEMLEALEALYEHCAMVHKRWGDGSNQKEADAAILAGRAAIAKAKGGK